MRRESSQKLVGNDQFEGYAIDLIDEISKLLGFNYTLKLVPDGRYGSYNEETKEWDGMMGELLQQVTFDDLSSRLFYSWEHAHKKRNERTWKKPGSSHEYLLYSTPRESTVHDPRALITFSRSGATRIWFTVTF